MKHSPLEKYLGHFLYRLTIRSKLLSCSLTHISFKVREGICPDNVKGAPGVYGTWHMQQPHMCVLFGFSFRSLNQWYWFFFPPFPKILQVTFKNRLTYFALNCILKGEGGILLGKKKPMHHSYCIFTKWENRLLPLEKILMRYVKGKWNA